MYFKKMTNIFRFIVIIGILLFVSCSKETALEIPYSGDKIVVKSFLFTDQPVKVTLSKSRPLNAESYYNYLLNATIKFYENNNYIEDLICNPVLYVSPSNYMCKSGSEYSIYIYHEELEMAEVSVTIPEPTSIKVIDTFSINKRYTWRSQGPNEYGEEIFYLSGLRAVLGIKLEINDPPGKKNYYILDIDNPPIKLEFPEPGIYSSPVSYDSEEEIIDGWISNINYQLFNVITLSAYFSDKLFNGENFIITIFVLKEDVLNGNIHIKLYTISEGYYNYIKSVQEWNKNKDNPFAEPVIIYSNVVNGMGILGGASCYVDSSVVIQ